VVPTIRVDDDVFKALQKKATPFVDTPNDVLRRMLGLGFNQSGQIRKARSGSARRGSDEYTPQPHFRLPILRALVDMGGRARMADVIERLPRYVDLKRPGDFERTQSGAVLWENRAQWERLALIKRGLLKDDSPHGYWEITQEGRDLVS
jgi:hypothetical protein